MNADDRANASGAPAGTGAFDPRAATSGSVEPSAQQPFAARPPVVPTHSPAPAPRTPLGATPPQSGQVPQRTSIRQGLSGQQPVNPTGAPSGVPPTSGAQATRPGAFNAPSVPTGTQPRTAVPTPAEPEPTGLKALALKAKATLTEGDDVSATATKGGPRKVRVLMSRIDPWSAMKMGFLLSVAAGIMLCVAVFVVWNVLNQMGLFTTINDWILQLFTEDQELNLLQFFDKNKVMSATVLVAVVNVVLLTALTTLGAFLYNTVASVVGGVYVTMTDD